MKRCVAGIRWPDEEKTGSAGKNASAGWFPSRETNATAPSGRQIFILRALPMKAGGGLVAPIRHARVV